MAERSSAPKDPFDVWREWLDRTERQVNSVLNDAMSSRQFGQVQSKLMEVMLGFQKSMNEATQRYFSTLNVPTRGDVIGLAERLGEIEERLAAIEHLLRSGSGPTPRSVRRPAVKPKRTRRPPSSAATSTAAGQPTSDRARERPPASPKKRKTASKPGAKKAKTKAKKKAGAKKKAKKSNARKTGRKASGRKKK